MKKLMPKWLKKDALLISLSAFFADAGYQALIAGFPIFLVIYLHAPAYLLGVAMAFAYGIGSAFAYIGGVLADRFGKKAVALFGNILISILSFTGFSSSAAEAGALFSLGWWFRNFRTPARRAMLGDITSKADKGKVYGFLNALDIGGGLVAVSYLALGLVLGAPFKIIFLATIVPILISSLCLALVDYKGLPPKRRRKSLLAIAYARASRIVEFISSRSSFSALHKADSEQKAKGAALERNFVHGANPMGYYAVLIATLLYGLSFYSFSFPVLTVAQQSGSVLGASSYIIFLLFSAIFGYIVGSIAKDRIKSLAVLGYMLAGAGSFLLGYAYMMHLGIFASYLAIAVLGVAAGSIETLEPAIISSIRRRSTSGSGMGMLSASRSLGLFASNLIVGFLYMLGPFFAYSFSALLAVFAGSVLLYARSKTTIAGF